MITHGAFDSQNLAFWDTDRGEYRAYWRYFGNGVRAIRTATSKDFITWENEADLTYTEGTPTEHLYTNAIQKYFRAPHLFIGFPTRFEPKSQQVEPILMTSRDGDMFHRYRRSGRFRARLRKIAITIAATTWRGECSSCPDDRTKSRSTRRRITTNRHRGECGDSSIAWTVSSRCEAAPTAER